MIFQTALLLRQDRLHTKNLLFSDMRKVRGTHLLINEGPCALGWKRACSCVGCRRLPAQSIVGAQARPQLVLGQEDWEDHEDQEDQGDNHTTGLGIWRLQPPEGAHAAARPLFLFVGSHTPGWKGRYLSFCSETCFAPLSPPTPPQQM